MFSRSILRTRALHAPMPMRTFSTSRSMLVGSTTGNKDTQSIGKSHATGESIVPEAIQKAVPEGVERALPNAIHDTSGSDKSTYKSHAKDGGEDSMVPKAAQKAVPESVERGLPDEVHNTGDSPKR